MSMKVERLFKRFIDDHRLSLQPIEDLEYIEYALKTTGKYDEWTEFVNRVKERFNDNVEEYFKYYGEVKESFLNSVKNSVEFIKFNQRDMNEFKIEKPNVSKSIYTKENDGKYFLSIDLKQANFQALKYCGLFKDYNSWEDLIGNFTDFPELINSKYMRSVLFGQLNPSRHITIESYLINNLRPYFTNLIPYIKLVMMASDEMVFEIDSEFNTIKTIPTLDQLREDVYEKYDLKITADVFQLKRHALLFKKSNREVEFFEKDRLMKGIEITLHCIPSTYYLLAYKLFNKQELDDLDFLIEHDGIEAEITEAVELI